MLPGCKPKTLAYLAGCTRIAPKQSQKQSSKKNKPLIEPTSSEASSKTFENTHIKPTRANTSSGKASLGPVTQRFRYSTPIFDSQDPLHPKKRVEARTKANLDRQRRQREVEASSSRKEILPISFDDSDPLTDIEDELDPDLDDPEPSEYSFTYGDTLNKDNRSKGKQPERSESHISKSQHITQQQLDLETSFEIPDYTRGITMVNYTADDLPLPGTRAAPSFEKDRKEELYRFLENCEELWRKYKVQDEDMKKNQACRYADAHSARIWKATRAFRDSTTWEEFKKGLIELYPEVKDLKYGSVAELNRLFQETRQITEYNREGLYELIRELGPILHALNENTSAVSNREVVERFLAALSNSFRSSVKDRIETQAAINSRIEILEGELKKKAGQAAQPGGGNGGNTAPTAADRDTAAAGSPPIRHADDPYKIDEVIETAKSIVNMRTGTGTAVAVNPLRITDSNNPDEVAGKSAVKIEATLIESFGRLESILQTFAANQEKQGEVNTNRLISTLQQQRQPVYSQPSVQPQMQVAPAPRSMARTNTMNSEECYYCNEFGHRQSECPSKATHLSKGWIVQKNDGTQGFTMGDGGRIPADPTKLRKQRVEEYMTRKQNETRAVTIQELYGDLEEPVTVPGVSTFQVVKGCVPQHSQYEGLSNYCLSNSITPDMIAGWLHTRSGADSAPPPKPDF